EENRQRDLAALARAGFSFGIAKKIIDAVPE
ncbi:MAG TPA: recombinase RecX, partial [Myxococcaceae bacterium]|nr:recombinase RecX [Myxococcaceae bacterium]